MRLRNLIPFKAKLQLYKTAVLLYLTYCHLVWHFCKASDSHKRKRCYLYAARNLLYKNASVVAKRFKTLLESHLRARLKDIGSLGLRKRVSQLIQWFTEDTRAALSLSPSLKRVTPITIKVFNLVNSPVPELSFLPAPCRG